MSVRVHVVRRAVGIEGAVVATPEKPKPYAVVLRRRRVLLRSEPVETVGEGDRLLARLLADVAADALDTVEARR